MPISLSPEQQLAIDVSRSVWVTASAGSGKTKVLTDRFLALLLSGVPHPHILALTYTNAGASVMANRIVAELSLWAVTDDADLRQRLAALLPAPPSDSDMALARSLFFSVIESPVPLKVQTIHSYCQSLLQQFPFEAGITVGFDVMDESQSAAIVDGILDKICDSPQFMEEFSTLLDFADISKLRQRLAANIGQVRGFDIKAVKALLLPGNSQTVEQYHARTAAAFGTWASMMEKSDKETDRKHACIIRQWLACSDIETLAGLFNTKDGPRKKLATAAIGQLPDEQDMRDMFDKAYQDFHAGRIYRYNAAFYPVLEHAVKLYEKAKADRALLDYDDIIEKAAALLCDSHSRDWVLYNLDYRVSHVLVDEAQDTSPRQWDIVKALTQDFFAGQSRSTENRTLMVVGDPKQSIFSFQGADMRSFAAAAQDIGIMAGAGGRFSRVGLSKSFRSSQGVLDFVDKVLDAPPYAGQNLSAADKSHVAHFTGKSARIIVAEPVSDGKRRAPDSDQSDPADLLVAQTVRQIRELLDSHTLSGGRRVAERDIMILVKTRDDFSLKLIRELKLAGIRIHGIDRIRLLEHQAVVDLMSVVRWAITPGDDLAMAEVIKGPLLNMDDVSLEKLALGRGDASIYSRMQSPGPGSRILDKVLASRHLRPFEFLSLVLDLGMRRRLIRRLGLEAADVLDEFLTLSLDFEKDNVPTLQAFASWLGGQDLSIKRDLDQASAIRLMTVHAAKGLQAPIVIIPAADKTAASLRHLPDKLLSAPGLPPLWLPQKPSVDVAAGYQESYMLSLNDEGLRLLYVAMTRAEEMLIISALKPQARSWYQLIREVCGEEMTVDYQGDNSQMPAQEEHAGWSVPAEFPPFDMSMAPAARDTGRTISPSKLTAKPMERQALRRGQAMHRLIEVMAANGGPQAMTADPAWIAAAARVVADPSLSGFFGPDSRAEVPIAGFVDGQLVVGQIDRIVFGADSVDILDFKTGSDKDPDKHLPQMRAYMRVVKNVFKNKEVRGFLYFTDSGLKVRV
ncbi:MAG: UvrD-helicase domain-containing protein [Alphaproteobacteria bacterium]|nr:UvrD-helicase domain-containing protein [Alphaproteobacteria bacterium]